jgi:hypothetical protein
MNHKWYSYDIHTHGVCLGLRLLVGRFGNLHSIIHSHIHSHPSFLLSPAWSWSWLWSWSVIVTFGISSADSWSGVWAPLRLHPGPGVALTFISRAWNEKFVNNIQHGKWHHDAVAQINSYLPKVAEVPPFRLGTADRSTGQATLARAGYVFDLSSPSQ